MIYLYLFLEFFKIGLFTFGGGYAMIPLVEDTVLSHNWLTEQEFLYFLGVCESTPGPIAVNMATYVGSVQGGILGSLIASIAVVLPSFIIILIIAAILKNFTKNRFVKAFLRGVKPIIIGLILATGIMIFVKSIGYNTKLQVFNLESKTLVSFIFIAAIYFLVLDITKKKLPTWAIILLSIVVGIIVCINH